MKNKYAPVLITTLNRHEHLKNCIESLQNNTLANKTDIFISVDYPPSEKYVEGYKRICEYFHSTKIDGFNSVHVFFQEKNLGPNDNYYFLENIIKTEYEFYIFSEDDNIFSKNFLEYMNFYLEKYKDDDSIYSVCGHSIPVKWNTKEEKIIINRSILSAYGYGKWIKKEEECNSFTISELKRYMRNPYASWQLFKFSKKHFCDAINAARGNHYLILNSQKELVYMDITRSIYLTLKNKYVIMSTVSKVRNMGYDGSGVNCSTTKNKSSLYVTVDNFNFSTQEIDMADRFDGSGFEISEISKKEYQLINKYLPVSFLSLIKSIVKWFLFQFTYKK